MHKLNPHLTLFFSRKLIPHWFNGLAFQAPMAYGQFHKGFFEIQTLSNSSTYVCYNFNVFSLITTAVRQRVKFYGDVVHEFHVIECRIICEAEVFVKPSLCNGQCDKANSAHVFCHTDSKWGSFRDGDQRIQTARAWSNNMLLTYICIYIYIHTYIHTIGYDSSAVQYYL